MKLPRSVRVLIAIAALSVLSAAATLTGTVTNGTTGKPSAGDDVALLELSQGMNEAGSTKTDAQGRFSFKIENEDSPHLVRINHQDVNYFAKGGPIPPGTTSVTIEVYDVAKKVPGIALTVAMMRLQAEASSLQVVELYAVKNASSPPKTQMSDRAFEIVLPEGAQIDASLAAGPGGQPVSSAPVPTGEKNRYAFVFPLRPGETRFQLSYHLPYSGKATFQPKLLYPAEHLVVMLPKSMQFTPNSAASFQPMGEEQGADVRVATGIKQEQNLGFSISGTGLIQEAQEAGAEAQSSGGGVARGRPGGGLGAPEETPDPLHQYRWYILGGLGAALALGAFYVVTRPPAATVAAAPSADFQVPADAAQRPPQSTASSAELLDALKEELFQLKVDRHQGRISQEEYEKSKAALDHTIARATARKKA